MQTIVVRYKLGIYKKTNMLVTTLSFECKGVNIIKRKMRQLARFTSVKITRRRKWHIYQEEGRKKNDLSIRSWKSEITYRRRFRTSWLNPSFLSQPNGTIMKWENSSNEKWTLRQRGVIKLHGHRNKQQHLNNK